MERCTVWDGITIGPGTMADYEAVAGFHYRGGGPRGVVRVGAARWEDGVEAEAAVGELGNGNWELGSGAVARLMGLRAADVSGFLAAELQRFAKRKAAGVEGWLAEARERVGAVPVYYLWQGK